MNWLRRLSLTSIVAVCLLGGPSRADAQTSEPTAQLRIVQTSADRAPIDLIIDGRPRLFNFPPGATSAYLSVKADLLAVTVRPSEVGSASAPINIEIQMKANTKATLFPLKGGKEPGAVLVEDDLPAVSPGAAELRYIHLSSTESTLAVEPGDPSETVDAHRSTKFRKVTPGLVDIAVGPVSNGEVLRYQLPMGVGQVVSILILDGPDRPQIVAMNQRDATPFTPSNSAVAPAPAEPNTTAEARPAATGTPSTSSESVKAATSVSTVSTATVSAEITETRGSSAPTPGYLALTTAHDDTHAVQDLGRLVALGGIVAFVASTGRRRRSPR